MESWLAAIPLGCKQPKTRPRVGTKKTVRSNGRKLTLELVQKRQSDHDINTPSLLLD